VSWIRSAALFLAGIVVGTIVMQTSAAQQKRDTAHRLNHVGIRVNNFRESLDFYTKVMGFKQAYSFPPNPDGSPTTTFLQINKDTFIEMAPATPTQPAGLNHIGLYTEDANATVTQLRQAGATVTDARPSANSGSVLATINDPNQIRIEVNQQPPTSLMGKAMASWK
jgi:catechol 2,3-dioxygenase-like lactoylglutathione lyase family enzyme